tara:strand:+ start:7559 stop:8377 length:819 start_codon:yes stop_codon:yes gene_type:complete
VEDINKNENDDNAIKQQSSNNVIQVRKKSATSDLTDNKLAEQSKTENKKVVKSAKKPLASVNKNNKPKQKNESKKEQNVDSSKKSDLDTEELINQINILKKSLDASVIKQKVGIFVDVPNLLYGVDVDDGTEIDMGNLLSLLSKDRELVRATAYSPIVDDSDEPLQEQRFVKPFVLHNYRIVTKPMKRFSDGSVKGNLDIELVVDMITMSDRLDVIILVSGDADFLKAIQYAQSKGIKVEVASFPKSTSVELKAVADEYLDLSKLYSKIQAN